MNLCWHCLRVRVRKQARRGRRWLRVSPAGPVVLGVAFNVAVLGTALIICLALGVPW